MRNVPFECYIRDLQLLQHSLNVMETVVVLLEYQNLRCVVHEDAISKQFPELVDLQHGSRDRRRRILVVAYHEVTLVCHR